MSCCGKSRAQMKTPPPARVTTPLPAAIKPRTPVAPPSRTVAFEYTGRSRLIVVGPVTHTQYDFSGPGARLNVDYRDSVAVSTVPSLRRV